MFKLVCLIAAALALFAPAAGKPQVVVDYPYYAAAPAYVAAGYNAPLTYSYPYAYAYSYPLAYY